MIHEILSENPKIEIYNADCMDILKTIPDKSINLVLTDPPYGIGKADWDKEYPKGFEKECGSLF